jgi:HD superfamily phosphohydrolase
MDGSSVLNEFQERVNKLVSESLSDYNPQKHAKEKSIRDAVWGTSRFYPWEVAILDSPLLQRLRDIRQTGLSFLVYPTAVHTRFDHTLGVVRVASRIVQSINEKHQEKDPIISYADHMRIRLSALLHDVGHSCLSHVSEAIFGSSEKFLVLRVHINEMLGVTPKPHEIMSWLVVQSQPFKEFVNGLVKEKILVGFHCTPEHINQIAGNIIGYRENPSEKFHADIINGPMDADKLDYLLRDAYFAGPTVVYDLERFLHTVDAIEYPRDNTIPEQQGAKIVRLSIPIEGVTALEQVIISKLMLFSYLYHHHKIRCVEGMCHEALKRLVDLSSKGSKKRNQLELDHPVCFLSLSDRSILPAGWPPEIKGDKVAGEIINKLVRRDLYKRALVISRIFIQNIDTDMNAKDGFNRLLACASNTDERDYLRQLIFDKTMQIMSSKGYKDKAKELRKTFKIHHILVDIPKSQTIEETEGVMIPTSSKIGTDDKNFTPLSDMFPIEKWVDAYNAIKWRGHIFTLEEAVPFVNLASKKILAGEPFYLHFTDPATELCKIKPPSSDNVSLFNE